MRLPVAALAVLAVTLAATATAQAQAPGQQPANEQVIEPQVPRRDVRVPKIPSSDVLIGAYVGTYGTENFGASTVYGARLGYHITEDFFVEATYAQTKVSDESFRQILPGGVFANAEENLTYYNLSAGVNILPAEVFFGSRFAKPSAVYLIAGVGGTKFLDQRKQTISAGIGFRVFVRDWMALQVDFRDHVYSIDLLGRRSNTQNLELTGGLSFFFF